MPSVIFDLDGTLVDTSGDLIAAANMCFQSLGHGDLLDPKDDMLTAFAGARAMLRLGFERIGQADIDDMVEQHFAILVEFYRLNIDRHSIVYPDVETTLQRLLSKGYKLGICTNKPESLADNLLRKLNIRHYFGSLVGADTLPRKKPHPLPYRAAVENAGGRVSHSCLIGDTITDRDTARAAGVPIVLVTFGPAGQGISTLDPDALLHRFTDLEDVVLDLVGPPQTT